jgi:hypothetical protein
MRNLIALSCLMLVAYGQSALSADKPVVVAAVSAKPAEKSGVRAVAVSVASPRATREASIPVGVLESFGAVGLAP